MANLSLIEVFHPNAVNGGAQASGAIGLSKIHTFRGEKQEEARHLASITPSKHHPGLSLQGRNRLLLAVVQQRVL